MTLPRFTRRTVLAGVDVLGQMTQADFSRYIRGLGADLASRVQGEGVSLQKRLNSLIDLHDDDPSRIVDGRPLSEEIVEKAASLFPSSTHAPWQPVRPLSGQMKAFERALELDGFAVGDQTIRRSLPADIGLAGAQDVISQLLTKHDLSIAKGHLDQALDAHGRGDWAAANSQIRTFLDAILDDIAVRIDPAAETLKSGHSRCTKLASSGFLSRELNEWDDGAKGFVNGLRNRLNPHGSHPGLSSEEDSSFRLHTVLITARLLLNRFDKWVRP